MHELEQFRAQKDEFFRSDRRSPLTSEQQRTFSGLAYFPFNPALRFEVTVEPFSEQDTIVMQTSAGNERAYARYGRFRVTIEGQVVELTLYADEHGLFLPFVDALAGRETYPAGRYLEPQQLDDGLFLIDFNLAYNPYCAYNERWSCPLTPFENRVKVPIRAGEKLFTS